VSQSGALKGPGAACIRTIGALTKIDVGQQKRHHQSHCLVASEKDRSIQDLRAVALLIGSG